MKNRKTTRRVFAETSIYLNGLRTRTLSVGARTFGRATRRMRRFLHSHPSLIAVGLEFRKV